jgi:hypothetical protein
MPHLLFATACCTVPTNAVAALKPEKPSDDDVTSLKPPESPICAERAGVVLEDDDSVDACCKFEAVMDVAAAIDDAARTTPL